MDSFGPTLVSIFHTPPSPSARRGAAVCERLRHEKRALGPHLVLYERLWWLCSSYRMVPLARLVWTAQVHLTKPADLGDVPKCDTIWPTFCRGRARFHGRKTVAPE
jgi:hypothetical protein